MTDHPGNPYTNPSIGFETVETEHTVLLDRLTGATLPLGARIERITIDANGKQARDVVNIVARSADGEELLYPYQQPLYTCSRCGARPLTSAHRCRNCNRFVCGTCRTFDGRCRNCARIPWWRRTLRWLAALQ